MSGLDMLRGIAALCVVHFHVMSTFFQEALGSGPVSAGRGYLAVDFFFMLSGYVMARTYEQRMHDGFGVWRFVAARYRRLWPVMAIGTLIAAPMVALELDDPGLFAAITVANLLLVPIVIGPLLFPLNTPAWSILAELAANMAHALLFQRLSNRQLALVSLLLLFGLAAVARHFGSLNLGVAWSTAHAGLIRALFAYSIGILLWRLWRDTPPFQIPTTVTYLAMPALLLAEQAFAVTGWLIDVGFVIVACPLLIAGGLAQRDDSRIAHWLGAISFPLYAINAAILHWAEGLELNPAVGIACSLVLAAYIAHRTSPPTGRVRPAATA